MPNEKIYEVIIIGAGHSGLSTQLFSTKAKIVFEKGHHKLHGRF